jgi:molybdate transport repressor ModE-like protein
MSATEPWLGVELRHLMALRAIAREGSFRGAADALGYVQSAVSQQLAQLERLCGARLVDRARGSAELTLTAAGTLLVAHADELLARYERAAGAVDRAAGDERVRVVAAPGSAAALAPADAVVDADPLGALIRGAADLAIVDDVTAPDEIETAPLRSDPFVAVVAARSPLGRARRAPSPHELAALPLVALRAPAHDAVRAWLDGHGLGARVAVRAGEAATVQALVGADAGVAILPRSLVDEADPAVAVLELDDAPPPRQVVLAWRTGERPAPADAILGA